MKREGDVVIADTPDGTKVKMKLEGHYVKNKNICKWKRES